MKRPLFPDSTPDREVRLEDALSLLRRFMTKEREKNDMGDVWHEFDHRLLSNDMPPTCTTVREELILFSNVYRRKGMRTCEQSIHSLNIDFKIGAYSIDQIWRHMKAANSILSARQR